MTAIRFTAPIVRIGERTIVTVPDDVSAALPSRGQIAATGTIGGVPVHTVIEPDGRRGHWIDVGRYGSDSSDHDGDSDRDDVAIELEVTKAWPEPQVPDDFRSALEAVPEALATWNDITPMARWEWVRWIGATKNPETRNRRIHVGVDKLRKAMRRPCCFDLSSCTDPELAKGGKLIDA